MARTAPRFSASLSVICRLILLSFWDLGRFVFEVCLVASISLSYPIFFFFLHLGEVLSVCVVQVFGFSFLRRPKRPICVKNRFPPLLVCYVPLLSCMVINRTLSSLGSQFNTHTSLHLPFTNIGPLLQRFLSSYIFIEYSSPIPPFLLPIPYNLCYTTQRGCKFLCTGLCLGVAVYGSGNNKTRYNHGMSR